MMNFLEDWEGGGVCGRRRLNRYRYVYLGENQYINIDIGESDDEISALCSVEDLHLLQEYSWNAKKTGKHRYLKTNIRKDGKVSTLSFSRMVLGNKNGQIKHKNGNSLDNRRENIYIVDSNVNKDTNYIVPPVNKKKVCESLCSGYVSKWSEGKLGGSIYKTEKYWRVVFQNPIVDRSFFFSTYGGENKAKIEAREYHRKEAIQRGLVWNRYRTCTVSSGDVYLEVQAKYKGEIHSFFCDVDDLDLVKKYKWRISKRDHSQALEVQTSTGKKNSFHCALDIYKVTDHIDGNPLNNRRCNLRDGTKCNPRNHPKRKDNQSGCTGVSFNSNKNIWVVQWPEDEKRKSKSFSIIEGKRTKEEALEMAKRFRIELDERLNLHTQQYLDV